MKKLNYTKINWYQLENMKRYLGWWGVFRGGIGSVGYCLFSNRKGQGTSL